MEGFRACQAKRAAVSRFRRDVQHDRAEGRAAHPRVRDAHHVLDAGARELARNRQIAGFGHAGAADRPGILQNQEIIRRHVEVRAVHTRRKIFQRRKDDGTAFLLEQVLVGRRALEDRAARRQRAEQRDDAADR